MKDFNLSEVKSPESIQKRCWTMVNNWYRPSRLYGPGSLYEEFKIKLKENEKEPINNNELQYCVICWD